MDSKITLPLFEEFKNINYDLNHLILSSTPDPAKKQTVLSTNDYQKR